MALEKLCRFATSKVFESESAGQMCCDMCAAAAKVQKHEIPCVRFELYWTYSVHVF